MSTTHPAETSPLLPPPPQESPQTFSRHLTALHGYALLISCIIGSGIFASPSSIDANVPSPGLALLLWLLGGLLAWTGALTLASLGTAFPGEGGVQGYLRECLGDFAGFLAAWGWVTAVMPATLAILSLVFVETVGTALGEEGMVGARAKGWALAVMLVTVLMNCGNTRTSAWLGNVFVGIKLLSVGLLVLAGLVVATIYGVDRERDYGGGDWHQRGWFRTRPSVTPDGTVDWNRLTAWETLGHYSAAIYASLWAYSGWDKANYIAGELQNPSRQLPLALNTAIPTVIVSYVLVNAAYYILLPWKEVALTDAIAISAVRSLLGKAAGIAFAVLICLVIMGALNSNIFVTGRLTVAAANKKYIPSAFSFVGHITPRRTKPDEDEPEPRFNAPFNALILNVVLSTLFILFGNFRALLTFNGLTEYSFFFLTVLGDLVLRWRRPELERPVKPPLAVPMLFALVSGFVVVRGALFAPVQFGVLFAELAVGALWYWGKNSLDRRNAELR